MVDRKTLRLSRIQSVIQLFRWLIHTPWPVLALDMLRANVLGALFTFAFLRFGLPDPDTFKVDEIDPLKQFLFFIYISLGITVSSLISIKICLPVLIWHRRRSRLDNEKARKRALSLPLYQAALNGAVWLLGSLIFSSLVWSYSKRMAVIVGIVCLIGGLITTVLSLLQTEKILRPITVAAMANNPNNAHTPSVTARILISWAIGLVLPSFFVIGLIVLQRTHLLHATEHQLQKTLIWVASLALFFGTLGIRRLVSAISDPIKQLQSAQRQVQAGKLDAAVNIYDGSDIGQLQAGFNAMVQDLGERQRLRNLFGRYVGEDVARKALETDTELGGSERYVGVLFVDIVGSTRLAVNRPPHEVVELLNDFFDVVVSVVGRHGGFINKFQGDAALAIFGAPIDLDDFAGQALSAARQLRVELDARLGETDIGIGVSAGKVIAGHIGAEQRFEYTVIGDPVNEAARLTELAKDEPGRVLASARALYLASDAEEARWTIGEGVELRGRGIETHLARPIFGEQTFHSPGGIPDDDRAEIIADTSRVHENPIPITR